jgi:3'-5' exoribonuclease
MNNIAALKKIAQSLKVSKIANVVLNDKRFAICSGSAKPVHHHYGDEGLQKHTFEVVELCLQNNEYFKSLNKSVCDRKLFLAALFHDSGKMWDYTYSLDILYDGPSDNLGKVEGWIATPHKRNIHHISRSGILWSQAAKDHGFKDENDEVLHAILAHHGLREWGSPVSPNSRLAWLLHLCDCISARMDDVDKNN